MESSAVYRWSFIAFAFFGQGFILILPWLLSGRWLDLTGIPWTSGSLFFLIGILAGFEMDHSISYRRSVTGRGLKPFIQYASALVFLTILWLGLASRIHGGSLPFDPFLPGMGWLFMGCGVFLRIRALFTLKEYFISEIAVLPDHKLMTDGIYSKIRHPSEAGLILIGLGNSLFCDSIPALCAVIFALLPLSFWRMHLEDRLLERRFGGNFIRYRKAVPGLLLPIRFQLRR